MDAKARSEMDTRLRQTIIKRLDDLRSKIENNEELPHGPQDLDLLVGIDDRIEECLNNWYY